MRVKFQFNKASASFVKELMASKVLIGYEGERASVALTHEYGSKRKGVPARPFLRPVVTNIGVVRKAVAFGIKLNSVVAIGEYLVGEVRLYLKSMRVGRNWRGHRVRALKPATIKRKGSEAILTDTGRLAQDLKATLH